MRKTWWRVVFPDQLACAENLAGAREVPDHPLVHQTLKDCLHEVMDADGFLQLLTRLQSGELKVVTRDLAAPSPLAQEILTARPYAFLDDAPAEERRTLAVQSRGVMSLEEAGSLASLDPAAIARVREEVWPTARDADELHDALVVLGFLTEEEGKRGNPGDALDFGWSNLFLALTRHRDRATAATLTNGQVLWVAAERLHEFLAVFPDAELEPSIGLPLGRSTSRVKTLCVNSSAAAWKAQAPSPQQASSPCWGSRAPRSMRRCWHWKRKAA